MPARHVYRDAAGKHACDCRHDDEAGRRQFQFAIRHRNLQRPVSTMSDKKASNQMWGGRFASGPAAIMEAINASIGFDRKLYAQDIRGSLAHADMLAQTGIISAADQQQIAHGLNTILVEIETGTFEFSTRLEDIHMNVEARLAELIGAAAGRLHTARSRNDQVAVDFRLWVKRELERDRGGAEGLDRGVSWIAPKNTRRPSCRASPICRQRSRSPSAITAWPMSRCSAATCRGRATPSGAWTRARSARQRWPAPASRSTATTTAPALGFREPTRNSIDSVSDRDFALEFLALAAICATHLSRLAEEIVIWSTPQFGFVRLSDAFSTGSSIMPQKKNPDAAELVRAKTGRVNGHLLALLTVMKGLPLTYSKDMQEDKEAVFDAAETLDLMLAAMTGMVGDMTSTRPR